MYFSKWMYVQCTGHERLQTNNSYNKLKSQQTGNTKTKTWRVWMKNWRVSGTVLLSLEKQTNKNSRMKEINIEPDLKVLNVIPLWKKRPRIPNSVGWEGKEVTAEFLSPDEWYREGQHKQTKDTDSGSKASETHFGGKSVKTADNI